MRKEVELSVRLKALADMVTPGNRVCDVGCDHGYLSIYLVQHKISPGVIAMDVRSGPLSRCSEHVAQYGLEKYIEQRLSDGLKALKPGEADTMVCAGMGGRLMQKILIEGQEIAGGLKELILQPQSEVKAFREFLRSQGYQTVEENMIEEEGKFYPMMKVVPGKQVVPDNGMIPGCECVCREDAALENLWQPWEVSLYDRFGKKLLEEAHPVLYRYLEFRKNMLLAIRHNILAEGKQENDLPEDVIQPGSRKRLEEIMEELQDINRAFTFYEEKSR